MNIGTPKLLLISLQNCGLEVRSGELKDGGLLGANCSFTRFRVLLVSIVLAVWFHLNRIRALKTSVLFFFFFPGKQAEKADTFLTSSASQLIQNWRQALITTFNLQNHHYINIISLP